MAKQIGACRVLLVDRLPSVREALRWALEDLPDLTVVGEAGDGAHAIDLSAALRPDLVIMDIALPGMEGSAVVRALKALPAPPLVVVLSTRGDPATADRALDGGADRFVEMSAPWDVLVTEIRDVLARRHASG